MTAFTKNFEKLTDLQELGVESARNLSAFAVEAFEKLTRQNYALAGDVLELAVEQAKVPADVSAPEELIERQVAIAKSFGERLTDRARGYFELGKEFSDASAALLVSDFVQPAKKQAKSAKQKAA